jgi:hypothetical protein
VVAGDRVVLCRSPGDWTGRAIAQAAVEGGLMKRREFFSAAGLGAVCLLSDGATASTVLSSTSPEVPEVAQGRPRIGCVSWCFHTLATGGHPEEAIDIIGSLGFDGIELIANSRQDVDEYWTDATITRIRGQLERNHLQVSQFPFFQPVVEGLASRHAEERKQSLDYFESGCRLRRNSERPW